MGTTRKAVEMPTEQTVGDKVFDEDKTTQSPGRGPRAEDNVSSVPDRQLNIRSR